MTYVETIEGLDLFSPLGYYGRLLLKSSPHNSRVVSLGGVGNEVPKVFLDDLDLNEPGNYTPWNMINHVATSMTLPLSPVAKEKLEVEFIFNFLGLVPTGIHAGSMFRKCYVEFLIAYIRLSNFSGVIFTL